MRRLLAVPAALATAVLPVVPAAAGGGCGNEITEGATTTVLIGHACFEPGVTRVRSGAQVRWVNASGIEHNVTGPGGIGYAELPADATITFRVSARSGIYPYACTLHPGMSGALVVGDGSFSGDSAGSLVGTSRRGPADTAAAAESDAAIVAAAIEEARAKAAAGRDTGAGAGSESDGGSSSGGDGLPVGATVAIAAVLAVGLAVVGGMRPAPTR